MSIFTDNINIIMNEDQEKNYRDYELRLKHMEIAMTNGRHHETVRNNAFNFYLILAGLYFAGVYKLSELAPHKPIPILVALLIFALGLIISLMILRIRIMVMRDVRVIEAASNYPSVSESLIPIDLVYKNYYVDTWNSKNIRMWGVSKFLLTAIAVISAGGLALGTLITSDSYSFSSTVFALSMLLQIGVITKVGQKLDLVESMTDASLTRR